MLPQITAGMLSEKALPFGRALYRDLLLPIHQVCCHSSDQQYAGWADEQMEE
jgi:hypothetical protein